MGLGGSGHVGFAGARVRRVRARVGSKQQPLTMIRVVTASLFSYKHNNICIASLSPRSLSPPTHYCMPDRRVVRRIIGVVGCH
jgi:hypothetical protein